MVIRRALAARAARLDPDLATTAFIREDRGDKVFLDSTRAGGATVVSVYSPRIRPGVPVSPWPLRRELSVAPFEAGSIACPACPPVPRYPEHREGPAPAE